MTSPKRDEQQIGEMLAAAISSAYSTGANLVTCTKDDLVANLHAFGEEEIAIAAASLEQLQLQAIFERAGQITETDLNLDRALCLAAVEVIEGRARPLARKRRKSAI